MPDPFNLEQFKQGRKAITRDGRVAEFLFHRPDFYECHRLGAVVAGVAAPSTSSEDGKSCGGCDASDLAYMAPAEHGIAGMPWNLPTPIAPPEGYKWEYRGMGWEHSLQVRYICYDPYDDHNWDPSSTYGCPLGYGDLHYLEAVPIIPEVDPYAEFRQARSQGKVIECKRVVFDSGAWATYTGDFDNLDSRCELRIKPDEFPPAPEGKEWWNRHKLTPKQVGVSDGWRLLLKGETIERNDEFFCSTSFSARQVPWEQTSRYSCGAVAGDNYDTHRTKRPLPAQPKNKALTKSNLPYGPFFVRWVGQLAKIGYTPDECLVVGIYEAGLDIMQKGKVVYRSFEDLHINRWQFSSDRTHWRDCCNAA